MILKSRLFQMALMAGAIALMTYLYLSEKEKRSLEHEAHAVALELSNKEIKKAVDAANHNAEMLKLIDSERKLADVAARAAYEAAEMARSDAVYLRSELKKAGKNNPAFAHCLDLALPDELRLYSGKSGNNSKNGSGKGKDTGKPVKPMQKGRGRG